MIPLLAIAESQVAEWVFAVVMLLFGGMGSVVWFMVTNRQAATDRAIAKLEERIEKMELSHTDIVRRIFDKLEKFGEAFDRKIDMLQNQVADMRVQMAAHRKDDPKE